MSIPLTIAIVLLASAFIIVGYAIYIVMKFVRDLMLSSFDEH